MPLSDPIRPGFFVVLSRGILGSGNRWYGVDILLGSRLPVAERTGSSLQTGYRVDLPVHAALYTNRKNVLGITTIK